MMPASPMTGSKIGGLAKSPRMQKVQASASPAPVAASEASVVKTMDIDPGSPKRPLISPIQSPVRTAGPAPHAEKEQAAAGSAVKVKDFASPAAVLQSGKVAEQELESAALALQAPLSPTIAASANPTEATTEVISASKAEKPVSASLQSSSYNPTSTIPPSPIFSSFLSHGPQNRPSAFSFVGLPGRSTGPVSASATGGGREKSLGLGLGLGLGKSLSAARQQLVANTNNTNGNGQDSDSQGSSSASAYTQSFHSALSSTGTGTGVGSSNVTKKRLSAALMENSSQYISNSGNIAVQGDSQASSSSSKIARTDTVTNASSRVSMSMTKEEETKAKFEALRSRISSFKGVNAGRMSSAALPYAGRPSVATAGVGSLASSSRMSTVPATVLPQTVAAETTNAAGSLFSPPASEPKTVQPTLHASVSAQPGTASDSTVEKPASAPGVDSVESKAQQATIAPASAVPSSFGFTTVISNSFANLFGMSTSSASKLPAPPTTAVQTTIAPSLEPMAAEIQEKEIAQELSKPAQAVLYPSLPSTTGLVALASPKKDQRVQLLEDEEAVEELVTSPQPSATKGTIPIEQDTEARSRRSSSASVQDIVDAFEAKAAIAARSQSRSPEQQRKRASEASHILYPKLPSASSAVFSQPAPTAAPVQARSTTPDHSPSKTAKEQVQRLSLTLAVVPAVVGESGELDIEDPDVEPIARASSVGTEAPELEEEDEEMQGSPGKAQSSAIGRAATQTKDTEEDIDSDAEMGHLVPVKTAPAASNKTLPVVEVEVPPKPPAKPFVPSKSTSASSTFKPTKPVVEIPTASQPAEASKISRPATANGFNRPISRAPSMASLAPSRASTISVASSVGVAAALTKSATASSSLNKRAGLASSVSGKPEVKSLQLAAQAAKKVCRTGLSDYA